MGQRESRCRRLVAGDDGLEELDVFANVTGNARQPIQEQTPNPGGVRVETDQDLFQVRITRSPVDLAVHMDVVTQHLTRMVGVLDPRDRLGKCRQPGPGVGRRDAGRTSRSRRLQQLSNLGDVSQVRHVDSRSEGAATGVGDDQPVTLEALERFPHRGTAKSELGCQPVVIDRLARPDIEHHQSFAHDVVSAVGIGLGNDRRAVGLAERQLRQCHRHSSKSVCSPPIDAATS